MDTNGGDLRVITVANGILTVCLTVPYQGLQGTPGFPTSGINSTKTPLISARPELLGASSPWVPMRACVDVCLWGWVKNSRVSPQTSTSDPSRNPGPTAGRLRLEQEEFSLKEHASTSGYPP